LTDTGETLSVTVKYLKRFRPKEVRTAVLLHKTCSKIVPDYFVKRAAKWRWVIFPWHFWEDLTGFIKELHVAGISRIIDLSREVHKKHNIDLKPDTVREILSRMK
jgi:hypoxanthine phosphoribosyltransferase